MLHLLAQLLHLTSTPIEESVLLQALRQWNAHRQLGLRREGKLHGQDHVWSVPWTSGRTREEGVELCFRGQRASNYQQ